MQQQETSKFFAQVTNISNNILAKLVYQKNYLLMANQVKNDSKKTTDKYCKTNILNNNWPDLNEINSTLEEFDSMLHEFEFQSNY